MKTPFASLLLLLLPFFTSADEVAPAAAPTIPSGKIYRSTKQQILATIPPASTDPVPFLTSLSGKYTALLLRTPTAPGAGGFGNDFCIIQVQDTETKQALWESECAPVSTSNACTLIFDDDGLEVFDGAVSVYSTDADGNHVNELELVDQGDMRIIDKDGELSWKATDEPRSGQRCGLPGSVGLAPETPPFAGVIGSNGGTGPFGQGQQAAVAAGGGGGGGEQVAGDEEQPLVGETAYDSGSLRGLDVEVGLVALGCFVCGLFI